MRHVFVSTVLLTVLLAAPATAQDTAPPEATRIEIDQEAGRFTFIVKGQPQATLDEDGLNIFGPIRHSAKREHLQAPLDAEPEANNNGSEVADE